MPDTLRRTARGRPRNLTDAEELELVEFWLAYKTIKQKCREMGISTNALDWILRRRGFKKSADEPMYAAKRRLHGTTGSRPALVEGAAERLAEQRG